MAGEILTDNDFLTEDDFLPDAPAKQIVDASEFVDAPQVKPKELSLRERLRNNIKAAAVGINEGITRNVSDEFGAALGAGLRPVADLAGLGDKVSLPGETFEERRKANLGSLRDQTKDTLAKAPIAGEVGKFVGSAVGPVGGSAALQAGRQVAEGAVVGFGASEADTAGGVLKDTMTGATIGGVIPTVAGAVQQSGSAVKALVGKKGEQFVGNSNLLKEAEQAPETIAKIKNEQGAAVQGVKDRYAGLSVEKQAEITEKRREIANLTNQMRLKKRAFDDSIEKLSKERTESARQKIASLLDMRAKEVAELSQKRDAYAATLDDVPLSDNTKGELQKLRTRLITKINEQFPGGAAQQQALVDLDAYLPSNVQDFATEGDAIKVLKNTYDNLWNGLVAGQGGNRKSFNKKDIAGVVRQSIDNIDPEYGALTGAIAGPLRAQQSLRKNASSADMEGGAQVFNPDPSKAIRRAASSPERAAELERQGFNAAEFGTEAKELAKRDAIRGIQDQRSNTAFQRDAITQEKNNLPGFMESEVRDTAQRFEPGLERQESLRSDLNELKSPGSVLGAATALGTAGGAMLGNQAGGYVGGAVGAGLGLAAGRKVGQAFGNPVNVIKAYNLVSEKFKNAGLTASIRLLETGNRAITYGIINKLAEQYQVNPDDLRQTILDGGGQILP